MKSLLTVTDFADSYDLTVLATAKSELGINLDDETQDVKITLLIHQISNAISTLCKRIFAEETIQEVFRLESEDDSTKALVLSRRPISSITSVTEDAVLVPEAEYETDFKAGLIYRLTTSDFRQSWGASKITVVYVAGYYLLDDLPYDVEKACLLWIKHTWAELKRKDIMVRVEDVPGVMRQEFWDQGNRSNPNYDPPAEVMVLLQPYMEHVVR
jgi:hypothetical protein